MAVTLPTCLRRRKSVRVGLDLVEVADVAAALASPRAARYLDLVYTAGERRDCETPSGALDPSRLAARFAAKEAAWKALGVRAMALGWRSIEVVRAPDGEPTLHLDARAAEISRSHGLREFAVSLSHEPAYAGAVVVATP
jgi:holo-[acyl-carrier protein] synthase